MQMPVDGSFYEIELSDYLEDFQFRTAIAFARSTIWIQSAQARSRDR